MKWNSTPFFMAITLPFISIQSDLLAASRTLHNSDEASYLHTQSNGKMYIQLGSFKNKSNAERLLKNVQAKINYPVTARQKNGYYVVTVGPLSTTAEVRAASQELGSSPSVIHHERNRKSIQQVQIEPPHERITRNKVSHPILNDKAPWKDMPATAPVMVNASSKVDVFLSVGAAFSNLSNDPSVQINNVVTNTYDTNTSTTTKPLYGVGVSHTFDEVFNRPVNFALGLAGYYTGFNKIGGIEHPFSNVGSFDTLNYQFKADTYSLMVEPRLIYSKYRWQPFVLGGIGGAWNRLYGYSETPTDPASSAAPVPQGFSDNTSTSFAYEVGIGLQRQFFNSNRYNIKYLASLDYRYMNFGTGQLGSFPSQTSGERLQISPLELQAVVFTLKASI